VNEHNNASWMDAILNALRSPGAMMIALVLALVAQGEHTAQVFAYFAHGSADHAQPLSYAFAGAVEVAVLLFVLKGHKHISYAFAVATFATNMVYYAIGGIDLLSVAVLPVLLLSVLLPGVIVGYSHTIAETPKSTDVRKAATPTKPAKVRRHFWQFWRPRATATAATNTPQRDRQTGLESTRGIEAGAAITASEIEAPSGTPVDTAQAQEGAGKPPAKSGKPAKAAKRPANPNRNRALQMRSEGFNASEIAGLLNEKESTVASWLYRGAQKNGVAK